MKPTPDGFIVGVDPYGGEHLVPGNDLATIAAERNAERERAVAQLDAAVEHLAGLIAPERGTRRAEVRVALSEIVGALLTLVQR